MKQMEMPGLAKARPRVSYFARGCEVWCEAKTSSGKDSKVFVHRVVTMRTPDEAERVRGQYERDVAS